MERKERREKNGEKRMERKEWRKKNREKGMERKPESENY
jgi:hypothetical protein